MTILDGKKLSQKILSELKGEIAVIKKKLRIGIVVVGKDPVVEKFIAQKKKIGDSIGIEMRIYAFEESITTNELRKRLNEIVHEKHNHGIVIQLPLPQHINTQYILNAVVPEKDIDMLSSRSIGDFVVGKSAIIPPVAGAIKAFFDEYKISYKDIYVVVAGAGNLVGRPVALWLLREGVTFGVVRSSTVNPKEFFSRADIIISGVGKSKCITADMVKDGVIVIDAGTSESEGKVVGDADFDELSKKASYITPVPGGVGPVAVAMLFKNLVTLIKEKR